MGVSNIQKWFFSEKAFREQLRSWGWIYLFFASFSLLTGLISFGVTLRWFPISDMLRALLLDSLLTLPVMFLPGMLATGVLVLSFVPFFCGDPIECRAYSVVSCSYIDVRDPVHL